MTTQKNIKEAELLSNQPTINIGTVGSVSHGKTTTVRQISTVRTQRYQEEVDKNKTIHLGYANSKIYQCQNCLIIKAQGSNQKVPLCTCNDEPLTLVKHISFVDCPGHEEYMATMISGTAIMDCAILLVAANEKAPQEQTLEHLIAVQNTDIKKILILQNKLDLVTREQALTNYQEIKEFVQGSIAENADIIPISAQTGQNIDQVYKYILGNMFEKQKNLNTSPLMNVVRSFNINHPDTSFKNLKGGVLGGSLLEGVFNIGDNVEIRPGFVVKNGNNVICYPLLTKIESLYSEKQPLEYAVPGGLIGVGLQLDSSFTHSDHLIGQMIGHVGQLPPVYLTVTVKYQREGCVSGLKKPKKGEKFRISINSKTQYGVLLSRDSDSKTMVIELEEPVCLIKDSMIAIMRWVGDQQGRYRIYYKGKLDPSTQPMKNVIQIDQILYQKLQKENQEKHKKYHIESNHYQPNGYHPDYMDLLDKLTLKDSTRDKFILDLPRINVQYHNRKTIVSDVIPFCQSMEEQINRTIQDEMNHSIKNFFGEITGLVNIEEHFLKFIKSELPEDINMDSTEQLIISKRYNQGQITNIITRYCIKNKKCPGCGSMRTKLSRRNRKDVINCLSCLSVIPVQ